MQSSDPNGGGNTRREQIALHALAEPGKFTRCGANSSGLRLSSGSNQSAWRTPAFRSSITPRLIRDLVVEPKKVFR